MIRAQKIIFTSACLMLAACTDIPDFSSGVAADVAYPEIIATDAVLGQVPADQGDNGISDLEARAAALRARAEQMRATGVTDSDAETEDTAAQS